MLSTPECRPSFITVQLVDEWGSNITQGGMADSLSVSASPPPLSGSLLDNRDGTYTVEIVHEWETLTDSAGGVRTNITVLVEGKHVPGSPFMFRCTHQYAISILDASTKARRSQKQDRRFAYVTLLANDDFVHGALVLADSLERTNTPHPLIAMVTHTVSKESRDLLSHIGVEIRQVDPVPNPFSAFKPKLEEAAWQQVYTKIQAWSLTDFLRVVFLDADQVVLCNIDSLFTETLPEGGFAAAPDVAPPIFFNSGMMLITPSSSRHADLLSKTRTLPSYDDGDQGYLNAYFEQNWHRLSYAYNFMKSKTGNPDAFYWILNNKWDTIKIVHMVGVKPWRCTSARDCGGFPERVIPRLWALWWDAFMVCVPSELLTQCFHI